MNRLKTDAIYIDFQKAFDSISHPKLLAKLESYNIRGDLLAWITAFLQHHTQQVRINDTLSDSVVIISGVPQGSVLDPTSFLLYINDLVDGFAKLDCSIKLMLMMLSYIVHLKSETTLLLWMKLFNT